MQKDVLNDLWITLDGKVFYPIGSGEDMYDGIELPQVKFNQLNDSIFLPQVAVTQKTTSMGQVVFLRP